MSSYSCDLKISGHICAPYCFMFRPIKLVCSDEEVSPICKPWLNLTFPGSPGTLRQPTPGTQCEWLMKKDHQQDQPCCYKDFTASEWNEEVCDFAEKNVVLKQTCRVQSPPVVYMLEKTCKLSIRNPSEQDVGCYEGSMPWNAPDKPHFRQCVSFNEICPSYTIEPSCKVKLWFIEFGVCAIILAIFLTIAAIVFRNFRSGYTQPSEEA